MAVSLYTDDDRLLAMACSPDRIREDLPENDVENDEPSVDVATDHGHEADIQTDIHKPNDTEDANEKPDEFVEPQEIHEAKEFSDAFEDEFVQDTSEGKTEVEVEAEVESKPETSDADQELELELDSDLEQCFEVDTDQETAIDVQGEEVAPPECDINTYDPVKIYCGVGVCAASGFTACEDGVITYSCVPGEPTPETCDLLDNNCDGNTDEGLATPKTSCGLGSCVREGLLICLNGETFDTCVPGNNSGSDNNCNNIDEDCDGSADEHFVPSLTICGTGICLRDGLLLCTSGTLDDTCISGSPETEACDLLDNDCDGATDETCACVPATFEEKPTACGVGACADKGKTKCVDDHVVDTCVPKNSTGEDDDCDGIDDNCSGTADENFIILNTSCGVGACATTGKNICMDGVAVDTCKSATPAATDPTCNNIDDDCDGFSDEDFVGSPTSCGIGACLAVGATYCANGIIEDSCESLPQAVNDKTCNSIDDDCNGSTDEGFVGTQTSCGTGACATLGATYCSGGSVLNGCMPLPPAGNDATCNNIDDDCNGATDEDFVQTATACGVGACENIGHTICEDGEIKNSCTPKTVADADANCNNIDDDCNGATDDGFVPFRTNCGLGVCAREGLNVCVGGVTSNTCVTGQATGQDNNCNGTDEDCDGTADEHFEIYQTFCGAGICAAEGMKMCVAGNLQDTCAPGSPEPEDCDLLDNNCDGVTDEGCVCVPATYVEKKITCGVGACENNDGHTECLGNVIVEICEPKSPTGTDNDCDGVDDNCNGITDENFIAIATACGVGECVSTGQKVCDDAEIVDTCKPLSPAPTDATCNNKDDDCSGSTDEDYIGTPTACGVGACLAAGATYCASGIVNDSCVQKNPAANDATCNNVDDDCNGATDEDFAGVSTSCGIGACARSGATYCSGGVIKDSCTPLLPATSDANCNNIDDDCNGSTDEGFVSTATACGVGACANTGHTFCEKGAVGDSCAPKVPAANDSTCNNIDDDCSGTKDEDFVVTATACGIGECASTGQSVCVEGVITDTCKSGTPAPTDATCNNKDDDCNGATDEDFVGAPTSCGVGACISTGATYCAAGVINNSCAPKTPAANDATCNNKDDDCNGETDEDFSGTQTSCGVGACATNGLTYCSAGVVSDGCVAFPPALSDSNCDNIDDNCNSVADEEFLGSPTSCGVGACATTGATYCANGAVEDSCYPGSPAANDATCNNIDEDCNGTKDEDFVPTATNCGVGACATSGATYCSGGNILDNCAPLPPAANDATCNSIDEDCNNEVDEDFAGAVTWCGVGECSESGVEVCTSGAVEDTCVPGMPAPETCDLLDNDCDSAIDEICINNMTAGYLVLYGKNPDGTKIADATFKTMLRSVAPAQELSIGLEFYLNGTTPPAYGIRLCDFTASAGSAGIITPCTTEGAPIKDANKLKIDAIQIPAGTNSWKVFRDDEDLSSYYSITAYSLGGFMTNLPACSYMHNNYSCQ